MAAFSPQPSWFEGVTDAHVRAWRDLASAATAVASLPAVTLGSLLGVAPSAPSPPTAAGAADLARALEEALAANLQAQTQANERAAAAERLAVELRASYARLEDELAAASARATADLKLTVYHGLESLLTQLPVVRHAVAEGREVAAADLLALLAPLDLTLAGLGFRAIGGVGERVGFDRALHQLAAGSEAVAGMPVTVRHVGYRLDDHVLRRARVVPVV